MNLINQYKKKNEEYTRLQDQLKISFNDDLSVHVETRNIVFKYDHETLYFPIEKVVELRDWLIEITKE